MQEREQRRLVHLFSSVYLRVFVPSWLSFPFSTPAGRTDTQNWRRLAQTGFDLRATSKL